MVPANGLLGGGQEVPRELPAEDIGEYVAHSLCESTWRYMATVTAYAPASRIEEKLMSAKGRVELIDGDRCTIVVGAETLRTIALTLGRLNVDFTINVRPC